MLHQNLGKVNLLQNIFSPSPSPVISSPAKKSARRGAESKVGASQPINKPKHGPSPPPRTSRRYQDLINFKSRSLWTLGQEAGLLPFFIEHEQNEQKDPIVRSFQKTSKTSSSWKRFKQHHTAKETSNSYIPAVLIGFIHFIPSIHPQKFSYPSIQL